MIVLPLSRSGQRIPAIGLGVFRSEPGQQTYDAVLSGLQVGYRHVDTAAMYGNERDVARAIKDSGLPRSDVWVTTKIFFRDGGAAAYDLARSAIAASCDAITSDAQYIDLLLLHAPVPERLNIYRAMEDATLLPGSLVRGIGVSNFNENHLAELLAVARVPPLVNQIELHPFLTRRALVAYCESQRIVLEAYSPLAKAKAMDHPELQRIAAEKTLQASSRSAGGAAAVVVSVAQVLLKWGLQRGFVVLPKSVRRERQLENFNAGNVEFTLSVDEMAKLDALNQDLVTGWNPLSWT